jgi:alkaline phosphatase D
MTAPLDAPAFRHGVASGDPLEDRVVLWTRLTTPGTDPLAVRWHVVRHDYGSPVADGTAEAAVETDWTVSVDVAGLSAGTSYDYCPSKPSCGQGFRTSSGAISTATATT